MGLHDEARLDRKFIELAKLMNVYLNHFPKHEKYALAQEIRRSAYSMYGHIVEAQKRYHRKTALTNLDVEHERLRMLINLAHALGYFAFKDGARADKPETTADHRHLAISRLVDEMGKMIGGWIAASHRAQQEAS